MRAFIERLSSKYESSLRPPTAAQQKLAQLRREAGARRLESSGGSESWAGSDAGSEEAGERATLRLRLRMPPSPAEGGLDDRTGVPLIQRQSSSSAAASPAPAAACSTPGIEALAARLEAAEARLAQHEASQAELQAVRTELAELKEQHAALHAGEWEGAGQPATGTRRRRGQLAACAASNRPAAGPRPREAGREPPWLCHPMQM